MRTSRDRLLAFAIACSFRPNNILLVWAAASSPELQPLTASSTTTAQVLERQLKQVSTESLYENSWADGLNQEWDDYQQAWRFLGFFTDCDDDSHWHYDDDVQAAYNNNNQHNSGDEQYTEEGCPRYVLWAAYVDPYYEGGGIGEYKFWDREDKKWDKTSCDYNPNNEDGDARCAKMDCHAEDTHWQLLGLYKHRQPDDWMEQLFKHEGVCVWSKDEYSFMKNARKAWPKGCTVSDATTVSGRTLNYDMKPGSGGTLNIALYTDEKCTQEYNGVSTSVEQVLGNFLTNQEASHDSQDNGDDALDYSGWSLQQALKYWESSMDAFRICQPCVAYDINNVGYNGGNKGSSYGTYDCDQDNNGGDDDYQGGGNNCVEDDFDCYDDAGYTNVNQCMKFRAKTYMDPATLRDVMLAQRQGTLVHTLPLQGMQGPHIGFFRMAGNVIVTMLYGAVAISIFVYSVIYFRKARKDFQWPAVDMKKPLVFA